MVSRNTLAGLSLTCSFASKCFCLNSRAMFLAFLALDPMHSACGLTCSLLMSFAVSLSAISAPLVTISSSTR